MIIDANNLILGRIATVAAKKALLGENIDIINCENAIITGKKEEIIGRYKKKKAMGTHSTGPFYPRNPDRFVRRSIRGMLSYKKPRGKEAFKRIKCHARVPADFNGKKPETIKGADVSKVPNLKYIKVKELCKLLGANI